jgi:hypothetical protein
MQDTFLKICQSIKTAETRGSLMYGSRNDLKTNKFDLKYFVSFYIQNI